MTNFATLVTPLVRPKPTPFPHMHPAAQDIVNIATQGRPVVFLDGTLTASANVMARQGIPTLMVLESDDCPQEELEPGVICKRPAKLDLPRDASIRDRQIEFEIDQFDPRGQAIVVAGSHRSERPNLRRHQVIGVPEPSWRAFEDKITVNNLFRAAGVRVAPHTINSLDDERLLGNSFHRLNRGSGIVVTTDNRVGENTGGYKTLRVTSLSELRKQTRFFASLGHQQARLMSYLPGISMSIGGFILPTGKVLPLLPVENVTVSRDGIEFKHLGMANSYRPAPRAIANMEATAVAVGTAMHRTSGYVGAFGLDGMVNGVNFSPIEVNARFAGGFRCLNKSIPDVPLGLINAIAISTSSINMSALERVIGAVKDAALKNPQVEEIELLADQPTPNDVDRYGYQNGRWQVSDKSNVTWLGGRTITINGIIDRAKPFTSIIDEFARTLAREHQSQIFLHRQPRAIQQLAII